MKVLILLALAAFAAATELYDSNNDNLDIDAIVANTDTLKQWYSCLVENGTCDAVQSDFKKDVPEAVKEACAKCTDAQKHIFRKFLAGLKEKLPKEYDQFKAHYDPENKYFNELEKAVANA